MTQYAILILIIKRIVWYAVVLLKTLEILKVLVLMLVQTSYLEQVKIMVTGSKTDTKQPASLIMRRSV